MATFFKACSGFNIVNNLLKPRFELTQIQIRGTAKRNPPPKKRYPPWLPKQHRMLHREDLTRENTKFVQEVIASKYGVYDHSLGMTISNSPLLVPPIEPQTQWTPSSRRTGLIGKKIGIYPIWLKNGKKVLATLLQIVDNHVIKYTSPENFHPVPVGKVKNPKRPMGCLIVGAEGTDPQRFTKEYCAMFNETGLMPKKIIGRFIVSPDAALQPGTPLLASHFKPGEFVDIRGKTVDRGFQGVMKRYGFHGQPATHGQTKTHRRPGNIGSGGEKARVMPGTKLPGHMGNRYRVLKGVKILRINTKYNVIWVCGHAIPGETNGFVYLYDTILPTKKVQNPNFPTHLPSPGEQLAEELYADDVHDFRAPSLEYAVEE